APETYFNPSTGPAAVAPGTAATWSYTFAAANFTLGHSYTVHSTTTDLGGNASTVDASTFTWIGSGTAPTVAGSASSTAFTGTQTITLAASAVPVNSTIFVIAANNAN